MWECLVGGAILYIFKTYYVRVWQGGAILAIRAILVALIGWGSRKKTHERDFIFFLLHHRSSYKPYSHRIAAPHTIISLQLRCYYRRRKKPNRRSYSTPEKKEEQPVAADCCCCVATSKGRGRTVGTAIAREVTSTHMFVLVLLCVDEMYP